MRNRSLPYSVGWVTRLIPVHDSGIWPGIECGSCLYTKRLMYGNEIVRVRLMPVHY